MMGQVVEKITVDVDASPARWALKAFAAARPSRGMRRKWARACVALRKRGEGWFCTDRQGWSYSLHLHPDLLALIDEAHLRARWLRGAA